MRHESRGVYNEVMSNKLVVFDRRGGDVVNPSGSICSRSPRTGACPGTSRSRMARSGRSRRESSVSAECRRCHCTGRFRGKVCSHMDRSPRSEWGLVHIRLRSNEIHAGICPECRVQRLSGNLLPELRTLKRRRKVLAVMLFSSSQRLILWRLDTSTSAVPEIGDCWA